MIVVCQMAWIAGAVMLMFSGPAPAADVDQYGDALPPGAMARLGTVRLHHSGGVAAVHFAPDGKSLVSTSDVIRMWNPVTGQLIRETALSPGWNVIAISPDGRHAAQGGSGGSVWLVDMESGRKLHQLTGHKHFSDSAAFSPDGKVLATVGRDDTIRFWDVDTGKELRSFANPGHTTYLAYTANGKNLISICREQGVNHGIGETCQLWDLEGGRIVRRWEGVLKPIALSPDDRTLAFGVKGFQLALLDLVSGRELRRFNLSLPHDDKKNSQAQLMADMDEAGRGAAFSPDGKLIAVGDVANSVHLLETATGKQLHNSQPFPHSLRSFSFSPDGKILAVGAWQRIQLWETATGRNLLPLGGHTDPISYVAFSPDGKAIATWANNELILWDTLTGREVRKVADERRLLDFAPDGNLLLQAQTAKELSRGLLDPRSVLRGHMHEETEGSMELCAPDTGKTVRSFPLPKSKYSFDGLTAAFTQDGKTMASGAGDLIIRLWDFQTGRLVRQLQRERSRIPLPKDVGGHRPLGFTRDGRDIVTTSDDYVLRIYDMATGKERRRFRIDTDKARLSPDGRYLVAIWKATVRPDFRSMSTERMVRIWDLSEDGEPKPTVLSGRRITSVAFSPSKDTIALSEDGDLVLREWPAGKELRRLKAYPENSTVFLTYSPDGQYLVSTSLRDCWALVWKVR